MAVFFFLSIKKTGPSFNEKLGSLKGLGGDWAFRKEKG